MLSHLLLYLALLGHHAHKAKAPGYCARVVTDSTFVVDGTPAPYCQTLDTVYLGK